MEVDRESNFGITGALDRLCEIQLKDWKGQPGHYKDFVKKKLRKVLYDALFAVLARFSNRESYDRLPGTKEQIHSYGRYLRQERKFDEAFHLEQLVDQMIDTKDDTVQAALQFLSLLSKTMTKRGTPTIGHLGNKLPVIFKRQTAVPVLPPGPKDYEDSCFLQSEERHFMHFPRDLFERGDLVPEVQVSQDCKLPPGCTRTGYFSLKQSLGAEDDMNHLPLPECLKVGDLTIGNRGSKLTSRRPAKDLEDDGYLSNSNSFGSSSSGQSDRLVVGQSSLSDSLDSCIWERALYHVSSQRFTWEISGQIDHSPERPYLCQAGPRAAEELYDFFQKKMHEGAGMQERVVIPERQLIKDVKSLLLGIPSISFPFDLVSEKFVIRDGLCVRGLTPYTLQHFLTEFLECGSLCHKLAQTAKLVVINSFYLKGYLHLAFTEGIHIYLQGYANAIVSLSPDNTLIKIRWKCQRLFKQMRYLGKVCERCELIVSDEEYQKEFSGGSRLLWFLIQETMNAVNTDSYCCMLYILMSCLAPFYQLIQDWIFHGMFNDTYGELFFMQTEYIWNRDNDFWRHAFVLKDVCVSQTMSFLKNTVKNIFMCGKTLSLLKLCNPQNFMCTVQRREAPRIAMSFTEEDIQQNVTQWAVYFETMNQLAQQVNVSREEMKRRAEQAKADLIERAKAAALKDISLYQAKMTAYRQEVDVKKRKEYKELKDQMEKDLKRRAEERAKEKTEDQEYMDKVIKREDTMDRREAELELQAREDLIKFYASLTEEAANRERKALWKIQRARLAAARKEYLVQQEVIWRNELQASYTQGETAYKKVKPRAKWNKPKENPDELDLGLFGEWQTEIYVPPPAQDQGETTHKKVKSRAKWNKPKENPDELDLELFGEWQTEIYIPPPAQDRTTSLDKTGTADPEDSGKVPRDLRDILAQSEENTVKQQIQTYDEMHATKESESESGDRPSVKVDPGSHPSTESSSEIQQRMTVRLNPKIHSTTESAESEARLHVRKVGDKNVAEESKPSEEWLTLPRLKRNPAQHASVESTPASVEMKKCSEFGHVSQHVKQQIQTYDEMHATKESESESGDRPSVKVDPGSHPSTESSSEIQQRMTVRLNPKIHSTTESAESEARLHVRKVGDKNVAEESKPSEEWLTLPRLKRNPAQHASVESTPASVEMKKCSEFGHVSQHVKQQIQTYDEMHATKESESESGDRPSVKVDPGSHPSTESSSEIQQRMTVRLNPKIHSTTESAESEARLHVRKVGDKNVAEESKPSEEWLTLPRLKRNPAQHASVESTPASVEMKKCSEFGHVSQHVKQQIQTYDEMHATKESESESGDRPSVKVDPGSHPSTESSSEIQQRMTVRLNPKIHSTTESAESEARLHVRKVGDKNVAEESKPSEEWLTLPRLKRNPAQHASVESTTASVEMKKCSEFGHVSQLSNMEFVIAAPKLRRHEQMHASSESDFKEYAIKPHIQMNKKMSASQESRRPGPSKPRIKINVDRHVSDQSELVYQEEVRINRFKQQNLYGHASDSSVQALLYTDDADTDDADFPEVFIDPATVAEESKPSEEWLTLPRLKRNPAQHASVESTTASVEMKKCSEFGHVSQLSNMEFVIAAPKLRRHEQMHASSESDFKEYSIKPHIQMSKKMSASQESRRPGPSKPRIKINVDRHVSDQSEFVDQDEVRINRFKQQNLYGHASDSSVQALLYTNQFGKSNDDADFPEVFIDPVKWKLDLKQLPVEMYPDSFEILNANPCGDLMLNLRENLEDVQPREREQQGNNSFQATSLARMMEASLVPPLTAQMSLVSECVLAYFYNQLQIDEHFKALRRYMLMQDGEFAHTLGEHLFEKIASRPDDEMQNFVVLENILATACHFSIRPDDKFASNLTLLEPDKTTKCKNRNLLDVFRLSYQVDWPLNIVITETNMEKYKKICSHVLKIRFAGWLLRGIWRKLSRDGNNLKALNSPHFHQLQLFRYQMIHLVTLIQGYTTGHVIQVTWPEFQKALKNVRNLEELVKVHRVFTETLLVRCLMNPKAQIFENMVNSIVRLIFNFYTLLHGASWDMNPKTGVRTHGNFNKMARAFQKFQSYCKIIFKAMTKLNERTYQGHFKELLLRMNFNNYYSPDFTVPPDPK